MNNSEAITASSRPRRCAVVWDSTPRPSVRGRAAVARIAASLSVSAVIRDALARGLPGGSVGAAHGAAAARVRRDRLARLRSGVTGAAGLAARRAHLARRAVSVVRRRDAGYRVGGAGDNRRVRRGVQRGVQRGGAKRARDLLALKIHSEKACTYLVRTTCNYLYMFPFDRNVDAWSIPV